MVSGEHERLDDGERNDQVDDAPAREEIAHDHENGALSRTTARLSTAANVTQARYGSSRAAAAFA